MGIDCGRGDPCPIEYRGQIILQYVSVFSPDSEHPSDNGTGAATSTSDVPNSNVALFDLAFPGSQPVSALQSSVGAVLIRMIGISNRNTFTGPAGCDRPELRNPACQSIRPQTLFLPGSASRIPNYTILW